MRNVRRSAILVAAVLGGMLSTGANAQTTKLSEGTPEVRAQRLIDKGIAFLKSKQKPDGGWDAPRGALAISALAAKGLAQDDKSRSDPMVTKAFEYILSNQSEDGGIYKDGLASYNTAICISALTKAQNPAYQARIDKAVAYLKSLQWSDTIEGLPKGEKVAANDPRIGGWGYGSKGRPDGSNTSFAMDALKEAGVSQDDPVFKKAAEFITRNQNAPTNDQPWATRDGGFVYSSAYGGESFAGSYTDESGTKRFNSYGSMTYAGMKSLLYAGISKDDPRVRGAWQWITAHWSLDENPGMQGAGKDHVRDGLFYYYHVLARSLREYGETAVPTDKGSLDWRVELINALELAQQPDGSWIGGPAYMETHPTLVTSYSVLALQEALADLKRSPGK